MKSTFKIGLFFIIIICLIALADKNAVAQRSTYPDAFTDFSGGGAAYCQGDVASNLSVSFTTCDDGSGKRTFMAITVTWYSNTVNSTSGGTQVAQSSSTSEVTTYTYSPSTGTAGTLYYYVEITWTNSGNACGNNSPLSTSTFTTTTQEVIINAPPTSSNAGSNQNISVDNTSLAGNTPTVGTGLWTLQSGSGSITSPNSPTSTVTGLGAGDNVFRWTISNPPCTDSWSEVTINYSAGSPPTITLGANPSVEEGTTSANLTYSATTNSPDQYSIDYDITAEGEGFSDVTLAPLPASPIVLVVPGGATPAVYNGILTVKNSGTGLTSVNYPITVTVTAGIPTITITDANPSVEQGVTSADVTYSATTFNPDQYSIDYSALANGFGFVDVTLAALPASPIVLVVPGGAPLDTYDAVLTVKNSSTGQVSGNYAITVTITSPTGPPTITLGAFPSVVEGTTSADLPYTATTNSPDQYSIVYDGAAIAAGFSDVTLATLPLSPIVLAVPGAAAPAVYNGTLTVKNSVTELVSGDYPFTVTVTSTASPPTITLGANPSVNEGSTTANLPYSATTDNPDQYSIDYDATAESQGFVDVSLAALPASPIVLSVPGGAAAPATYNGTLTVKNSGTGLTSGNYAISVTITANPLIPTIVLGPNPTECQGTLSSDLSYSSTTNNPNQYSINYNAAANAAGFIDVVNASLPASPINLVLPGAAAPGTYYGSLSVRNSSSGLSSGGYSISVTITTTATPSFIFGSTSVPESTTGLVYDIVAIPGATSYTWAIPSGWAFESGQGTTSITVTSGTNGQNGDITVYATGPCGTSGTATLAVTSEIPLDHSLYGCNACHITHNAPGGALTSVKGNANLCMSCHVSSGAASGKPFTNANKAIPGTSGDSHAWDVPSVNATYETQLTSDEQMVLRVESDSITCSVCHNQHNNGALGTPYLRADNTGDAMCKDCHAPRNKGKYTDDNINNRGTHPVGVAYSGTGSLLPVPTGNLQTVNGNVECSSCHQTHFATTNDGNLLRATNDNNLCTSCHNYPGHNGFNCLDCHTVHNTVKDNIYMIKDTINGSPVKFYAETGANSFVDKDTNYDGICEVCHTTTLHHRSDGTLTTHNDASDQRELSCVGCHFHNVGFETPTGPLTCVACHSSAQSGGRGGVVQIVGDGGEFDPIYPSRHTAADPISEDCEACHYDNGTNHPTSEMMLRDPDALAVWSGDVDVYCVKCHDGDPPAGITLVGAQYNKSAFIGSPHDYTTNSCMQCHLRHGSTNTTLLKESTNYLVCRTCHDGGISSIVIDAADIAIPGTSGTSHAFDIAANNGNYESNSPTNPTLSARLNSGNVVCSTCHDPHNNSNTKFQVIDNSSDLMCKDCHAARNRGRYIDNTIQNKGTHPVGLTYVAGGTFQDPAPTLGTASVGPKGGKVECSSCHIAHNSTSTDGNLLRQINNDALCTSCHNLSTHQGNGCADCHIAHNTDKTNIKLVGDFANFSALSGTNSFADGDGNYTAVCEVCHTSKTYFVDANRAVPGTGGTSHNWDVNAVNSTYETTDPTDPGMLARVYDGKINCVTCHDQHSDAIGKSLRVDNSTDGMCKDCHAARALGKFNNGVAINTSNIGSHPVGLPNPGLPNYNASPANLSYISGNVECSSCHGVHDVAGGVLTTDGNLLKMTNDNNLCKDCHTYQAHQSFECLDCHQPHGGTNIMLIKDIVNGSNVVFDSQGKTATPVQDSLLSFADGDGNIDGICEVCHTTTTYHTNTDDGVKHNDGKYCIECHPHRDTETGISFPNGSCHGCHESTTEPQEYPNSGAHDAHAGALYGYTCSECHFGLDNNSPGHSNGTPDVVFDPTGLASRFGNDAAVPTYNANKTCDNIYCHSNGTTSNRFSEGVAVWNSSASNDPMVYATTPAWDTGSITSCNFCHAGPPGKPVAPDYTIVEGDTYGQVTSSTHFPATGAHGSNTGAHNSPDQLIVLTEDGNYGTALSHTWTLVQCFWCHNNDAGAASGVPKKQGTYGTPKHVDGKTWFYPSWYGYGGHGEFIGKGQAPAYYTFDTEAECNALGTDYVWHAESAEPDNRPSMIPGLGYMWSGPTNNHCGNGKNCW